MFTSAEHSNSNASVKQLEMRARLLAKFQENECEKVDRCSELFAKYSRVLQATEESLRQHRFRLLQMEDEQALEELDDVENLYNKVCSCVTANNPMILLH